LQISEYEVLAVSAPVLCEPPVGNAPVHPPLAVQAVALVELHVSVAAEPVATNVGFALTLAVGTGGGGGGGVTATVAAAGVLVPPGPEHVSENDELVVRTPVL
jgi:hypothetical protein